MLKLPKCCQREESPSTLDDVLGILKTRRATVGSVDAFKAQVATSLTWLISVAFNLSSFAFIACNGDVAIPLHPGMAGAAIFWPSLASMIVVSGQFMIPTDISNHFRVSKDPLVQL